MEKDKMLQILIPAVAVAAIVVIVALIVGQSSPDTDATKPGSGVAPPLPPGLKVIGEVPATAEGVGMTKPDTGAPEWKDIGGGLKAWDVKEGEGEGRITESDSGLWHYTGWRPDGFVFDSSLRKGNPIPFKLTEVIQGWKLGLAGMKAGGIRRLYIPSALAYGTRGQGSDIPANTDLIFEVKLIRISRSNSAP